MDFAIREVCGYFALDILFPRKTVTIYFNSRQNAENVKRILEVDASVPNVATVCDMQKVVRCKNCKWFNKLGCAIRIVDDSDAPRENDYCSFAEINDGGTE